MTNNANYFFCYSSKLSEYIYLNGINYITKAIHPKSGQIFSLYKCSEELTTTINNYKKEYPRP